jgi:hypothetical protein
VLERFIALEGLGHDVSLFVKYFAASNEQNCGFVPETYERNQYIVKLETSPVLRPGRLQ